jgi:uncharacterized protein YggE
MRPHLLTTAILLFLALGLTACGNSDNRSFNTQPTPRISVSGEGNISLPPDLATLTLTVITESDEAEEAVESNSSAMADVMEAMEEEGIEEKDLRTSNFDIQPKYSRPGKDEAGTHKRRIVGYTVRHTLAVIVRDLDKVGTILQTSIELGVNQGGHIQFGNANPEQAINEARKLAIKDARSRAQTLARAADVELGRLLEVSEQHMQPQARSRAYMAADSMTESVPIAAGENSYRVVVNAQYGIEQ